MVGKKTVLFYSYTYFCEKIWKLELKKKGFFLLIKLNCFEINILSFRLDLDDWSCKD